MLQAAQVGPPLCRGADGEPKLVVTLTFLAKSLIPPWTLLQGRFLEAEIGVTIWSAGAAAKTLTTHTCKWTYLCCPSAKAPLLQRVIKTPWKNVWKRSIT